MEPMIFTEGVPAQAKETFWKDIIELYPHAYPSIGKDQPKQSFDASCKTNMLIKYIIALNLIFCPFETSNSLCTFNQKLPVSIFGLFLNFLFNPSRVIRHEFPTATQNTFIL